MTTQYDLKIYNAWQCINEMSVDTTILTSSTVATCSDITTVVTKERFQCSGTTPIQKE